MPSPSSSADQRASFSPSTSTSAPLTTRSSSSTTTPTTSTSHSTSNTTATAARITATTASTTATAATTTTTKTTTTTTITTTPVSTATTHIKAALTSLSPPTSTSPPTRRPESPTGPFADSRACTTSVGSPSSVVAARNGCVTASSPSSRHEHTGEAMPARRSSHPSSSSSSSLAGSAPNLFNSRRAAETSTRDDGLSASSAASPSMMANGALENGQQHQQHQQHQQQSTHHDRNSSQQQLIEYRERLTRDLEQRELSVKSLRANPLDKARISPILEGTISIPSHPSSDFSTASTESGTTVHGAMASFPTTSTPSYPFPRMPMPPLPSHAFQAPPPSRPTPFEYRGVLDGVLSDNSTPASNFTFHPVGTPPPEALGFPNPNLYDLSLMLTSEPGLDAWWSTVVQIMRDVYKAERVSLAVPADSLDIENVPWGQKATYNEHEEDDLSIGYMTQGSGAVERGEGPDDGARSNPPKRPGFPSRHSFTTYEENKEQQKERAQEKPAMTTRRPSMMIKRKLQYPPVASTVELTNHHTKLSQDTLEQHDSLEEERGQHIPSWEAPFTAHYNHLGGRGRVFPALQALNYEADPLIDHTGVSRVLERGRTVALTRTYPYLAPASLPDQPSSGQKSVPMSDSSKKAKKQRSESMTKLPSMFPGSAGSRGFVRGKIHFGDKMKSCVAVVDEDDPRPPTPRYEEYEQAPQSPWSQSPAPSPAVRPDTKENPFFTDAIVDEDSFNPDPTPADYSGMHPPEAIGVDNSWTVLRIPLSHALFSGNPQRSFKLNPSSLHRKPHAQCDESVFEGGQQTSSAGASPPPGPKAAHPAPIAILSILSPIIPYPANLRHSLDHLAPHLAHSFSLCRHYTNLETELAGLKRRRPQTIGFGAVTPYGRPMESGGASLNHDDAALPQSLTGSITSPSDYSALSRSAAGSPLGTPAWDSSTSLTQILDRRQLINSPVPNSAPSGSYFNSKPARQEWAGSGANRPRAGSKDHSPGEKRLSFLSVTEVLQSEAMAEDSAATQPSRQTVDATSRGKIEGKEGVEDLDEKLNDKHADSSPPEQAQARRGHTTLHSYGADFSATFQSLPPSSSLLSKPISTASVTTTNTTHRSGSFSTSIADLPPPSDRLKGLILDSLPAHVFVALPQTGEIVWVNSRYLSYRGQTVSDLSADPWGSIHPDELNAYLQEWGRSLRTGEQFSRIVRIRRFDGAYRWFYARAVASKDKRGVIMQFLGSFMDIHDQRVAEIKAARQEEIEASEAKHRLLANLIPQIIFTATEDDGITFANQQWLSYTGQSFEDSLRLGFMDYVHPEDLAKCRIPVSKSSSRWHRKRESEHDSNGGSGSSNVTTTPTSAAPRQKMSQGALSRQDSSGSNSSREPRNVDLAELARKGILKEAIGSDGRPSYATEVRLRSKTGEYRWHLIRCVEIDTIDFGRGASSYFGSATDINDHKLLEAKLKEAMESKSKFLSNMSHEIRTPLIGISGMVSFLQDTTLNEEQRDYTNTIQTSANSLIMIINDILDLSKVDAGMMKLKYEWFRTRSLIEDVNELVSTMAIAKRLELNYLVDADVPAWVKGDKVRIRQVLLNVIGNAIKFTSEGEVFSRCRVYAGNGGTPTGESEIMLEFCITDTGRGFTEEEKELIFKPFSQIDGSSTRQHGGSGLGLVISRQLVELHGGMMEGTAIVGQGSTFTFTARFTLPNADDAPELPGSPGLSLPGAVQKMGPQGLAHGVKSLPSPHKKSPIADGMRDRSFHGSTDSDFTSPGVISDKSHATDLSSIGSMDTRLTRFSEAAKASGQDLSQMRLEIRSGRNSPERASSPDKQASPSLAEKFRPPMYSILIICPQCHSREATAQHIEMTLPKDVPHQITAPASAQEAEQFIGGEDPVRFTHIVINLPSAEAVIDAMDKIIKSQRMETTTILILSDSVQRQGVLKLAAGTKYESLLSDNLVTFIYKPVKPSRFAVIFDPDRVQDLSTDWNRSTAQQMVESQKASYMEIERRMGHKGFRVLLVEDNPVNQKVLTKYLKKIGVDVDIAVDGVECTDRVLTKPHEYYSLILCDLHMPRKDGYQACRDIREWERVDKKTKMPIIALSANVMSDVQEKCVAAGFSDYVTKPVDFIDLSRAMSRFF